MKKEERGKFLEVVLLFFRNSSETLALEPKALTLRVMFSLVWESKVGFSMRQLMKTLRWFLTCWGFTCTDLLFLLRISSRDWV